jgi:hypothetical protein
MKAFIICLFLVSYSLSQQVNLLDGQILGLESSFLNNFFISATGRDCLNMTEGRCGNVYGVQLPTINIDRNLFLTRHTNLLWTLVANADYFCLRNNQFNSFLFLDNTGFSINPTADQIFGKLYLYRLNNMVCTPQFGWRISMIGNYYVLQSVQYPTIYLYFNIQRCLHMQNVTSRYMRRCGGITGFSIRNILNVPTTITGLQNNIYRFMFFNLNPINLPITLPVTLPITRPLIR